VIQLYQRLRKMQKNMQKILQRSLYGSKRDFRNDWELRVCIMIEVHGVKMPKTLLRVLPTIQNEWAGYEVKAESPNMRHSRSLALCRYLTELARATEIASSDAAAIANLTGKKPSYTQGKLQKQFYSEPISHDMRLFSKAKPDRPIRSRRRWCQTLR